MSVDFYKKTFLLYEPCTYFSTIVSNISQRKKEDTMLKTTSIEEAAILSAQDQKVCFVLTKENKYTLFHFCYYQLKHRTLKEFNCIIYAKNKDILYYLLRFVVVINSKKYTLIHDEDFKF
jgi:hypothetical protein